MFGVFVVDAGTLDGGRDREELTGEVIDVGVRDEEGWEVLFGTLVEDELLVDVVLGDDVGLSLVRVV